jgi:hypothetical protein
LTVQPAAVLVALVVVLDAGTNSSTSTVASSKSSSLAEPAVSVSRVIVPSVATETGKPPCVPVATVFAPTVPTAELPELARITVATCAR